MYVMVVYIKHILINVMINIYIPTSEYLYTYGQEYSRTMLSQAVRNIIISEFWDLVRLSFPYLDLFLHRHKNV